MAQTRRKRQTKHRGNAAGVVESRGRTGRKPTSAEKSGPREGAKAKQKAIDRRDRPPSWRSAFVRAMFAAVVLLLALILFGQSTQAITLFPVLLVIYTPLIYGADKWFYERRQRKKAQLRGAGKEAR
jgi:fatty acid desaturase